MLILYIQNHTMYLEIILGPMFSGKTTRIVELYHQFVEENMKVIAINFAKDTRYDDKMISTHDRKMIPCVQCETLAPLLENGTIANTDVVLINEGQFFPDIFDVVLALVERHHKKVYVCGLDGDFTRRKFGSLLDLIPYCDTVTKLRSNCKYCDGAAIFSHRVTNETAQLVIGSDNYVPLCRKCYTKTMS